MTVHTRGAGQQSRRHVLRNLSLLAGAGLALGASYRVVEAVAARRTSAHSQRVPVDHVLVACQENRSFDTYFGYYPRAGAFGVPSNYTQPDGRGGRIKPYRALRSVSANPSHA